MAMLLATAFCGCSKIMKKGEPVSGGNGSGGAAKPLLKLGGDPWSQMEAKRRALESYEMTMDADGKAMTMTVRLKDGQPVRMKMQVGEGTYIYVLRDKNETYMYDEKTKTAMKMPTKDESAQKPEAGAPGMPKMPDVEEMKAKSPNVKSESLDGVDCWVIEIPMIADGKSVKSWVDKEYGLPRQENLGDKTIKFSYKDINSVPDSAFELPAGTKIQDMSQMMPGKGGAPGMPKMPKPGG